MEVVFTRSARRQIEAIIGGVAAHSPRLDFGQKTVEAGAEGPPGRGTLEKEKPPILGLIERSGQVVMRMLPNVQQKTVKPIIGTIVKTGSLIHTDEDDIYTRLPTCGFAHQTACRLPCHRHHPAIQYEPYDTSGQKS